MNESNTPIVSKRELRRWARRSLFVAVPCASVIGLTAVVYGAVQTFQAGEPLSAMKMNANFDDLETRLKALETGASSGVPTGTVVAFAGTTAPDGWLMCDGSLLNGNDAKYAPLYKVIGTSHGGTASLATFNLPDYRGRFLRGVDDGTARDKDAASRTAMNAGGNDGAKVGTIQADQFASHNHGGGNHSHGFNRSIAQAGACFGGASCGYPPFENSPNPNTLSIANSGNIIAANGGPETRPVNAAVNFIIKL